MIKSIEILKEELYGITENGYIGQLEGVAGHIMHGKLSYPCSAFTMRDYACKLLGIHIKSCVFCIPYVNLNNNSVTVKLISREEDFEKWNEEDDKFYNKQHGLMDYKQWDRDMNKTLEIMELNGVVSDMLYKNFNLEDKHIKVRDVKASNDMVIDYENMALYKILNKYDNPDLIK